MVAPNNKKVNIPKNSMKSMLISICRKNVSSINAVIYSLLQTLLTKGLSGKQGLFLRRRFGLLLMKKYGKSNSNTIIISNLIQKDLA